VDLVEPGEGHVVWLIHVMRPADAADPRRCPCDINPLSASTVEPLLLVFGQVIVSGRVYRGSERNNEPFIIVVYVEY